MSEPRIPQIGRNRRHSPAKVTTVDARGLALLVLSVAVGVALVLLSTGIFIRLVR